MSTLLTGLVAGYKLDGNPNDVLGLNNGVPTSVSYGAGKIGQAASFTGASKINCGNGSAFNITKLTLSCWFRTSSLQTNKYLMGKLIGGGSNFYDLRLNSNTIGLTLVLAPNVFATTVNYNDNQWRHVVGTFDGTAKLYIDGVQLVSSGVTGALGTSTDPFSVGGTSGIATFTGDLDEAYVWNRALTQAEVTELYNSGKGLTYPFVKAKANFFPFFQ